MISLGIRNGKDLYDTPQNKLADEFGKSGYIFYERIRGVDDRPVVWQRERKSMSKERTYGPFLDTEQAIMDELKDLAAKLTASLIKSQLHGKTLVLKIRDNEFQTATHRATRLDFFPNDEDEIYHAAQDILDELGGYHHAIRLLGLTMTNLAALSFENVVLPLYK